MSFCSVSLTNIPRVLSRTMGMPMECTSSRSTSFQNSSPRALFFLEKRKSMQDSKQDKTGFHTHARVFVVVDNSQTPAEWRPNRYCTGSRGVIIIIRCIATNTEGSSRRSCSSRFNLRKNARSPTTLNLVHRIYVGNTIIPTFLWSTQWCNTQTSFILSRRSTTPEERAGAKGASGDTA